MLKHFGAKLSGCEEKVRREGCSVEESRGFETAAFVCSARSYTDGSSNIE